MEVARQRIIHADVRGNMGVMIEATCNACGTVNVFSDADHRGGAKLVPCEGCGAKISVGAKTTVGTGAGKPPAVPGKGAFPAGPGTVMGLSASPMRTPPVSVATPAGGGGKGDAISLADLPAPKRPSPFAELTAKQSTASLSALDTPELPAPKKHTGPQGGAWPGMQLDSLSDLPAPKPREENSITLGIDDLMAVETRAPWSSDLPAPKASTNHIGLALDDAPELPGPKVHGSFADLSTMAYADDGFGDLPAPKHGAGDTVALGDIDLLAPKHNPMATLPTPNGHEFDDLPAPKRTKSHAVPSGLDDLLAPKGDGAFGLSDLPAPKRPPAFETRDESSVSLDLDDLLAPKAEVPAPPTPKMRAPSSGLEDLLAPKAAAPAQPTPGSKARAKESDDLLSPSSRGAAAAGVKEAGKSKHLFDDLPAPQQGKSDLPTPKRSKEPSNAGSLFDDIPIPAAQPAKAKKQTDLDELDLAPPSESAAPAKLQAGIGGAVATPPPMLDLGDAKLDLGGGDAFNDLDLPSPTAAPSASVQAQANQATASQAAKISFGTKGDEVSVMASMAQILPTEDDKSRTDLDLDDRRSNHNAGHQTEAEAGKKKDNSHLLTAPPERPEPKKRLTPKMLKMIGAGLAATLAASAGGFYYYQQHTAEVARQTSINNALEIARKELASGEAGHWQRATKAANAVLQFNSRHAEALGLLAEASLAGALDEGTGRQPRVEAGKKAIVTAQAATLSHTSLDRAKALQALAEGQAERAEQLLAQLASAAPTDQSLKLYLAWAHLERDSYKEAQALFSEAIRNPSFQSAALYGRGRAKFALGDIEGAKADFSAVLAATKDHIGAQVGIAQTLPQTMATQRESDLLAILQRRDIDQADPRVVTHAWVLAGEEARRSGRLDAARERFRNATTIDSNSAAALVGLARTEIKDGKFDVAADLLQRAEVVSPKFLDTALTRIEVALKRNALGEADKSLNEILARKPQPSNPRQISRLQMLSGDLLLAQNRADDALARYLEAVDTAGDRDLQPLITSINLLGKMALTAESAKDLDRANQLRAQADQLLAPLVSRADKESEMAVFLGTAYLGANNLARAEEWLRKATIARPNDVEAHYQLGTVLRRLERETESIDVLRKAFDLDPTRVDVGIQLARTYEAMNRNDDATQMYDSLLAGKAPSLETRGRAGRFFARLGQFEKAAQQGAAILKVDPEGSSAGFFLKGEGLLFQGKHDDARRAFQRAVDIERDPQYLDGLGRACEQLALKSGDTKYDDEALRAYVAATELSPKMYNPLAGQGRILIKQREPVKALEPLLAANTINPSDGVVLFSIGVAYQELRQRKAAIAWLAKSLQLRPNADAANRLGRLYLESEQPTMAASTLHVAVRLGKEQEKTTKLPVPWLTDAMYWLGRVNSDLHNIGATVVAWEDFLGRNPPNQIQVDEVKRYLARPR